MRRFATMVLCLTLSASHAYSADNLFNSTTAIREEAVRLGDEALEVATTPVDTKGYGLIGTLAVGGAVGLTYLFDYDIREKVQGERGNTLDTATDIGSLVGNPLLHLGIAGAVYGGGLLAGSPKWRETGLMLGEAIVLADVASLLLKEAIGRGRPFAAYEKGSFRPFQLRSDYDSLPSMHAASSFAMASVLAASSESTSAKFIYYAAATFIGFSRIYQDKHWASDVILGAAIGELCGRVVTNYHASRRTMTLAPAVSGNVASLVLIGRW